jgi:hypothetical protein
VWKEVEKEKAKIGFFYFFQRLLSFLFVPLRLFWGQSFPTKQAMAHDDAITRWKQLVKNHSRNDDWITNLKDDLQNECRRAVSPQKGVPNELISNELNPINKNPNKTDANFLIGRSLPGKKIKKLMQAIGIKGDVNKLRSGSEMTVAKSGNPVLQISRNLQNNIPAILFKKWTQSHIPSINKITGKHSDREDNERKTHLEDQNETFPKEPSSWKTVAGSGMFFDEAAWPSTDTFKNNFGIPSGSSETNKTEPPFLPTITPLPKNSNHTIKEQTVLDAGQIEYESKSKSKQKDTVGLSKRRVDDLFIEECPFPHLTQKFKYPQQERRIDFFSNNDTPPPKNMWPELPGLENDGPTFYQPSFQEQTIHKNLLDLEQKGDRWNE